MNRDTCGDWPPPLFFNSMSNGGEDPRSPLKRNSIINSQRKIRCLSILLLRCSYASFLSVYVSDAILHPCCSRVCRVLVSVMFFICLCLCCFFCFGVTGSVLIWCLSSACVCGLCVMFSEVQLCCFFVDSVCVLMLNCVWLFT